MATVEPIRSLKTLKEWKAFIKAHYSFKHYVYTVLGLNTALRVSDLVTLRWDMLKETPEEAFFYLFEKKTGKYKKVILNDQCISVLEQYKKQQRIGEWVFQSESNRNKTGHWHKQYVYLFLNESARSIGIKINIGTHTLRKTFGYHAFRQGVDIVYLQHLFNHATPQITKRYLGVTQDEINSVYIRISL